MTLDSGERTGRTQTPTTTKPMPILSNLLSARHRSSVRPEARHTKLQYNLSLYYRSTRRLRTRTWPQVHPEWANSERPRLHIDLIEMHKKISYEEKKAKTQYRIIASKPIIKHQPRKSDMKETSAGYPKTTSRSLQNLYNVLNPSLYHFEISLILNFIIEDDFATIIGS